MVLEVIHETMVTEHSDSVYCLMLEGNHRRRFKYNLLFMHSLGVRVAGTGTVRWVELLAHPREDGVV